MLLEHARYESPAPRNAMKRGRRGVLPGRGIRAPDFAARTGATILRGSRTTPARCSDLFAAKGVQATFFCLGWIAERHPDLVRRIVAEGHELASHGYDHTRVITMEPARFFGGCVAHKRILEDIGAGGARFTVPELLDRREQPVGAGRAAGDGTPSTAPASTRSGTTCTACRRRRVLRSGCARGPSSRSR